MAQSDRSMEDDPRAAEREKKLRWKIDMRLCTIGGLLTSLNLIDSGIISSASVTSMLKDLELDRGNRFSVSILIFTVASVAFQLPATIAVRLLGPRIFFPCTTICFGLITLVRPKTKRQDVDAQQDPVHRIRPHLEANDSHASLAWYIHGTVVSGTSKKYADVQCNSLEYTQDLHCSFPPGISEVRFQDRLFPPTLLTADQKSSSSVLPCCRSERS